MSTAKGIRAEMDQKLRILQENCLHPSFTNCLETWAPGHLTGNELEICDVCEKVLHVTNTDSLLESQHAAPAGD